MGSWGEQYSVGNQGNSKEAFWSSGFKTCPQCKEADIAESSTSAGCRMNGDGYGTTEFKCRKCGWLTSFQYDDAAETYYYETSRWKSGKTGRKAPTFEKAEGEERQKQQQQGRPPDDEAPRRREDDVSGWGVAKVRQALIDHGIPERVAKIFAKEEVDGEVLFRTPPCVTRAFMTGHPKWDLDQHDVDLFEPVYRKLTGRDLQ